MSRFIDELAGEWNEIDRGKRGEEAKTRKREAIYYALDGCTPTTDELTYALRQVLAIDLGRTFTA
jgi:hypothetical protein